VSSSNITSVDKEPWRSARRDHAIPRGLGISPTMQALWQFEPDRLPEHRAGRSAAGAMV